jgi:DNA polymerase III subunit delta'
VNAPWLAPEFDRLRAALAAGRLGHALLIHGPAGWGQHELACALALAIVGHDGDGADATTLAHPDLRWLTPLEDASQIKVDDVRRLAHFIAQTPQRVGRKVAVIEPAHALNVQAANALLKTLEEPPPGSHLVLVTSALAELLPTIRSRCQLVAVRPTSASAAMDWVRGQRPAHDPDRLSALAFELGHAPMRLLSAIDADEQPLIAELAGVAAGRKTMAKVLEAWSKHDVDTLLERWMRYVADAARARHTDDARLEVLRRAAPDALLHMWQELAWARQLVRSTSNPNTRMLLESLLLHWRALGPDVAPAEAVRPDR